MAHLNVCEMPYCNPNGEGGSAGYAQKASKERNKLCSQHMKDVL